VTESIESRRFEAAPEVLFPVLLAFDRYPQWWPEAWAFKLHPDHQQGPFGVGTAFSVVPQDVTFECEVKHIEPDRRLLWHFNSPQIYGAANWLLDRRGDHTDLILTLEFKGRGKLLWLWPFISFRTIGYNVSWDLFKGLKSQLPAPVAAEPETVAHAEPVPA